MTKSEIIDSINIVYEKNRKRDIDYAENRLNEKHKALDEIKQRIPELKKEAEQAVLIAKQHKQQVIEEYEQKSLDAQNTLKKWGVSFDRGTMSEFGSALYNAGIGNSPSLSIAKKQLYYRLTKSGIRQSISDCDKEIVNAIKKLSVVGQEEIKKAESDITFAEKDLVYAQKVYMVTDDLSFSELYKKSRDLRVFDICEEILSNGVEINKTSHHAIFGGTRYDVTYHFEDGSEIIVSYYEDEESDND